MNYRRIRDARKALKMTQAEVAQRTGINRATLSKYETGEITPSLGQLEKLRALVTDKSEEIAALLQNLVQSDSDFNENKDM